MKQIVKYGPFVTAVFFALLFCYAALSKAMDFRTFQVQLAQSPLLSAYAGFISYAVIIVEVITVGLLCFKATRLTGLYLSFALMTAFTVYIWLILKYGDFIPCSCGGILEKMSWDQHLVFNGVSALLALFGIVFLGKKEEHSFRETAVALALLTVFSAGGMVTVFLSSENVIKKVNNFTRRFIQHPFEKEKTLTLGANSYYFAGADKDHIYLGNYTAPQIMTIIDPNLQMKKEINITIPQNTISFRSVKVLVNAPYFYVYDGSVPVIFRGTTSGFKARLWSRSDAYFTQLVVLDSNRVAFKSQNSITQKRTLGIIEITSEPHIRLSSAALGSQTDGMFASDGNVLYDAAYRKLMYVFFYKNPIVTMDDNLKPKEIYHTIDTVSHAKVSEILLKDGVHKMSSPPLVVNKKMVASSGTLYNESNLIGKYEDRKVWETASIVDLYAVNKPLYKGSLYIFSNGKDRKKMSHFFVHQNALFALFENSIVKFPFSDNLIEKLKNGEAENH